MPRSKLYNKSLSEIRKAVYNEVTKGEHIPPGKYNTNAVMNARRELRKKIKEHGRSIPLKPAPPFEEELGFEWSDDWVLPEKTATHIQEDWLELLEAVMMSFEDAGKAVPSEEEIIRILIPELFEEPLRTWEDYYEKAVTKCPRYYS